jgi:glycosyltransferase involved in cell wall biosynthesis
VDQLLASPSMDGPDPQATVVITTHDRAEDLLRCLNAVFEHTPPQAEIIVVDNAPSDDSTAEIVKNYPVRYLVERRKGASWGRRFGALAANNEIVAYIDDDVVVGPGWLDGLLAPFANPEVAAVTGLVMPFELETEAQEQFELHGFTFSRLLEAGVYGQEDLPDRRRNHRGERLHGCSAGTPHRTRPVRSGDGAGDRHALR